MKKIVIATDYSAEAENAMRYAAEVAADRGYLLIVFSLQNVSIHALNARLSGEAVNDYLKVQSERLDEVVTSLKQTYGAQAISHFATGDFYVELERCVNLHQADLVVIGMAQRSIEQDLLGNTTTAALARFSFPILAVPLTARYKGFKTVIFACDLVRGVQKKILDEVKFLAQDFGASVEVFHVGREIERLNQEKLLNDSLNEIELSLSGINYLYKQVNSTEIIEAIKDEVESLNADLLIMVPYKYGFWGSIVHRSKTRMMASGNSIPLLSIPL